MEIYCFSQKKYEVMREIKFRAWIKSERKFVCTDDWYELGLFGWISFITAIGKEKGYTPELQQFTGLKDKNGKEIYEGDILSGWKKGSNSDLGYIGSVQWNQECAGFIIKCHKFIIEIMSLASSGWAVENGPNIVQLDSFEVIGNIYEHQELLIKT